MHTLTLTQSDHIMFQLYEASTNETKIKSRKKSFFILLALSILVIFYGYLKSEDFLAYYGLFCTFLVVTFGNTYLGWRHKKHYTRQVKNNRNGRADETVQIEIIDNQIRILDQVSDSTIKVSEITRVNEIKDYYFLKLSTGTNILIPKTISALNDDVNAMIKHYHIPHVVQLDWKWK